jgi:hypothetical protein
MAGKNTIVQSVGAKSLFPSTINVIDPTIATLQQGDLVVFLANKIALPAAEADGASMLGVQPVTLLLGKRADAIQGTAVDAAVAISDQPGPQYNVTAKCTAKTGDAFTPGQAVFLSPATSSPDGIKNGVQTAGTKSIGIYQGPAIGAAAAGQQIEVLIGARYSNDTLKF